MKSEVAKLGVCGHSKEASVRVKGSGESERTDRTVSGTERMQLL